MGNRVYCTLQYFINPFWFWYSMDIFFHCTSCYAFRSTTIIIAIAILSLMDSNWSEHLQRDKISIIYRLTRGKSGWRVLIWASLFMKSYIRRPRINRNREFSEIVSERLFEFLIMNMNFARLRILFAVQEPINIQPSEKPSYRRDRSSRTQIWSSFSKNQDCNLLLID